jgi:mono/diheme cytochrome c family protein
MKRWTWISGTFILLLLALLVFSAGHQPAAASSQAQQKSTLRLGGELYDNWYASLGKQPPGGNMPLWSRQTTNTRSGPDTWRCVSCHGWDYQGKDGAYRAGSNYTGFPSLLAASKKAPAVILDMLSGKADPSHNFSTLMDTASLNALVEFITKGLVDDSQFIDPIKLEVIGGDLAAGKQLYEGVCAACHGKDGSTIKFRFDGQDATLGTLAVLDPWRFLHKTRYGTPGTEMGKVVGVDQQWTPQQGRDVLLYAQSLPTGLNKATPAASLSGREGTPTGQSGGPAQGLLTGLLTALGAMVSSFGFAILLGAAFIGVIFLLVWAIRGGRK